AADVKCQRCRRAVPTRIVFDTMVALAVWLVAAVVVVYAAMIAVGAVCFGLVAILTGALELVTGGVFHLVTPEPPDGGARSGAGAWLLALGRRRIEGRAPRSNQGHSRRASVTTNSPGRPP